MDDRAASRLLWLCKATGERTHHSFRHVVEILKPGDLLVLNDTRVTAVRLQGEKTTGGKVELLLLRQEPDGIFEVLAKPGKRLQPGARMRFPHRIEGIVEANLPEGRKQVRLIAAGDLHEALTLAGTVPLPPYIQAALHNPERYQTVYAERGGSAAAPTAGLHFTPELLNALREKGVNTARVTLDVGIDTFRPVASEDLDEHVMHGEPCEVPPETASAISQCQGRVVAVGTTAVRTLETFAIGPRQVKSGRTISRLFIRPGYCFQAIDGMFTNFHMPKTTMLMMISALAGREAVFSAYEEALVESYRFLSFGDSMLIL